MNFEYDHDLEKVLAKFKRVGLSDISAVELMDRIDSKYWFPARLLPEILEKIVDGYDLLEIQGEPIQLYNTIYYDTLDDAFYLDHQNGRSNRVKVRKREYVRSNLRFLEVKKKSRKGATIKSRMRIESEETSFPEDELCFLGQELDKMPETLDQKIRNQFKRITLVNKNLLERCTIDCDLQFFQGDKQTSLRNIAVVELKHGGRGVDSRLRSVLREYRIRSSGFSKYCIGRAMMQPDLKQNSLKASLRRIKQLASA